MLFNPCHAIAQSTGTQPATHIEERVKQRKPVRPTDDAPNIPLVSSPADHTAPQTEQTFGFILNAVVIEGGSIFSPEQLADVYRKHLATSVDEADVREIAQGITALYKDAGYIFSEALVPPQDVLSGVLQIRISEGYIASFKFSGDVETSGAITAYLEPVRAERPTRLQTVERALLLISDLPGVTVMDSAIADGDAPGAKVLNLQLAHKRLGGELYVDNRGTPTTGRTQSWTAVTVHGSTGIGSRQQIGLFTIPNTPRELVYLQGKWLQPVGGWGTTVEMTVSKSAADADADVVSSDTQSRSSRVTVELRHPIVRTREQSTWLTGALDYNNLREDRFDAVNYKDRNRTARAGLEYYRPELLNGDVYLKAVYSQGLNILGATDEHSTAVSRTDTTGSFSKGTLEFWRLQKIAGGVGVFVHAKGQWADSPLLTAEDFSIGGSQFGRAYDYGEISGQKAAAGLVELRYSGADPVPWIKTYDLYAFYDLGAVWTEGSERDSLASGGVGARGTFTHDIYVDAQLAQPLTRNVATEGNDEIRFMLSLGANF